MLCPRGMKKKRNLRLSLDKATLRILTPAEASRVAGANSAPQTLCLVSECAPSGFENCSGATWFCNITAYICNSV